MEIIVRKLHRYLEVRIVDGQTTLDLGFHDENQRRELAAVFSNARDELLDGMEDEPSTAREGKEE